MSAICGLVSFGEAAFAAPAVTRMMPALASHGPDQQRQWSGGGAALGHLLMRMTPEDRFDPGVLRSADGRFVLVADGRIDNRAELDKAWSLDRVSAARRPDSAYMLRAFETWGAACGGHLYGDFCFAVWDVLERRLTLVRDPIGSGHSLFHYGDGRFFAFATAPAGLFALPEVPRELDEEKLADFLILNHNDLRSTHYRGIYRLPPAHALSVGAAAPAAEPVRYWQPDLSRRIRFARDDDYVEAFNELFERVMADNLRSLHPVGAFMSGGIDSSAVAATAARQLRATGARLPTFTAVPRPGYDHPPPRGRYNDETDRVAAIAAMHDNLEANFIAAEGETPLDDLEGYFAANEAPFRNPCNRVWLDAIVREAGRRGLRTMLTGQSGNMTVSWDGVPALGDWLQRGHWLKFARGLLALRGYRQASAYDYLWGALRQVMPGPAVDLYRRLRFGAVDAIPASSAIHPDFAAAQRVFDRGRRHGFDTGYRQAPDGRLARWRVLDLIDYRGDLVAGWRSRFGVELRDPTGDRRLVEYCTAIPQTQFLGKGHRRWLAKRALADRLPPQVLNNTLRGVQDPGWHERLASIRPAMQAELSRLRADPVASRILNLDKLQRLLDDWPGPDANWESIEVARAYRLCLNRGLMVGKFVAWFEGNNA